MCHPDFRELIDLPKTKPVGMAALARRYDVHAPVRRPCAASEGAVNNSPRDTDGWLLYDHRYAPEDDFKGHLTFALRHETLDLTFLKRLFEAVGPVPVETMVREEPNGAVSRRAWYLYEWLTGERLDLEDTQSKVYVDLLDPKSYFTAAPVISRRHRLRDNLLGNRDFCPVVRRTAALEEFVARRWDEEARARIGQVDPSLVARAASFLLLADSQASYQIEGERPPRNRLERWMKVVALAGRRPLSIEELERLQGIVVEGDRFVRPGLREEGGFIGERDLENNPQPEFVSARHEDLPAILSGIIDADRRMSAGGVDAVIQATCTAFGLVFAHPFEDGNGRVHRYLMHHVLTERGYSPPGVTFPISSVLLDRQREYAEELRAFSSPLMPYIEWVTTEGRNVRVTNDTADLYRYGDYTDLSEFLYRCVRRTVAHDLPEGIARLAAHDAARRDIGSVIEMPDNTLSLLVNLVRQNHGKLSKRRREREFAALADSEVEFIENAIADAFESYDAAGYGRDAPDGGPTPRGGTTGP